MLETATKDKLANAANQLVKSNLLCSYKSELFIPVHWETERPEDSVDGTDRMWVPLSQDDIVLLANTRANILLTNNSEIQSLILMMRQYAYHIAQQPTHVLIKTKDGLRSLGEDGRLTTPSGEFTPNYLNVQLNTDEAAKAEVLSTVVEWVNGEDSAEALLAHVATALAPGWSAVKYLLLLGHGRNGKSLFLQMLMRIFGSRNVSHVSRQAMSELSPVCTELNSSLLNVILDGSSNYIKDSGPEKTLIAGEPISVRRLYESTNTRVQTNALFMEALNTEPKSRDKTLALQERIVRFQFPNRYELNPEFAEHMLSNEMTGALLALLIDRYVLKSEVRERLVVPDASLELKLEQMTLNSVVLEYVATVIQEFPNTEFLDMDAADLARSILAWMATRRTDITYSELELKRELGNYFELKRSSRRNKTPVNYYKIVGLGSAVAQIVKEARSGKPA